MELTRILANKKQNEIYGLIGNINITTNNNNYSIVTNYKFKGTVKEYLNSEKSLQALKIVMLNETYLNKKINELSESEIKIISLAKSLIENKPYIILDYFEKGLTDKEKENYKRLFKKLSKKYAKTILIFTNDLTFIWDICHSIFYVDNNEDINTYTKEEYYDIPISNIPKIKEFTNLLHEKDIKIANYKNVLDLLKAIYRLKGE